MKSGLESEERVAKQLSLHPAFSSADLAGLRKCGLFVLADNVRGGASPDRVSDTMCFEFKETENLIDNPTDSTDPRAKRWIMQCLAQCFATGLPRCALVQSCPLQKVMKSVHFIERFVLTLFCHFYLLNYLLCHYHSQTVNSTPLMLRLRILFCLLSYLTETCSGRAKRVHIYPSPGTCSCRNAKSK